MATTEDFSVVRQEGKRRVKRKLTHYSLDAVISVGYRVNSSRATQFRIWATRTLKQHLVDGYTLNQQRLQQRGIEMEQALSLLSSTLQNQQMISESGEAVLAVISHYARSWSLLQAYDEQSLMDSQQKQTSMQALELNSVLTAITELKKELIAKAKRLNCLDNCVVRGLPLPLRQLNKVLVMSCFTPMSLVVRQICCIWSSKITRWPMVTNVRAHCYFCGICESISTYEQNL